MKSLKSYLHESFKIKLSDFEDSEDNVNKSIEKSTWSAIKKWIEDNYKVRDLTYIYDEEKDIYKVSSKYEIEAINRNLKHLTNEYFEWDIVEGYFDCTFCDSLKTLKGAPQEVGSNFDCSHCTSLTSLEGAPREVGESFYCSECKSLKSLEGAPQEVGSNFDCSNCKSLKSLKGIPPIVKGDFHCTGCDSLKSLKGGPDEVRGDFVCYSCDALKTLEGAPLEINRDVICRNCKSLTSLKGLRKVGGIIFSQNCPNLKDFAGFTKIVK